MGLLHKNSYSTLLFTGIFFTCLLLFNGTLMAQVQTGDSTKSVTQPALQPGQGKGTIHNDSLKTSAKPSAPEKPVPKAPETKKETITKVAPVTTKEKDTLRPHNPKAAMTMSAILPGLGQVYNHKYWKVPVIYAGLGVSTYFIITETSSYRKYKETYLFRIGADSSATDWFPNETDNTIQVLKEYHHKNIEISYIAAGLIYLLNIVDATVDAHLYDFDVSDDLSMRIQPSMINCIGPSGNSSTAGISLTLRF